MEQGTRDWFLWRRAGIGSSDVPSVMGISPYRTAFELWEEKTSKEEPVEVTSHIMEKGKRLEPIARAKFELMMEKSFEPAVIEMAEYPFMRASLDGRSEDKREIIEIKYVGKVSHSDAAIGKIPPHYMCQMQHQLLVSGADLCHYVSYDEKTINTVRVLPDYHYMHKMLEACIEFWAMVIKEIPPPLMDKDWKPLRAVGLIEKLTKWKMLKIRVTELEKEMAEIEKYVKGLVKEKRMEAEGIRFSRITKVGSVDYSIIPELQGVVLDSYRKPSTEYVKMERVD